MHIRFFALAAAVVVASVGGCRPTLDGAWEGTSSCPQNQTYPTSMLVDENSDGEVEGTVFFENVPVLLFATTIVRADISDGAYDADKNEYAFEMQADDDTPVDFDATIEFDDEDATEASGDLRQFDNDGGVFQTCTVSLERLSIAN